MTQAPAFPPHHATPATPAASARRTAPRVLLAAAGVLLVLLAVLWFGPGQQTFWQPPAAQTINLAELFPPLPELKDGRLSGSGLRREDQLLLMQERPLFVMGRRPPPLASASAQPQHTDQWGTAQLRGTFASSQVTGAFVVLDGQPTRILQGQTVGGWELVDVQPQAIEIRQGRQKRQLTVQKVDLTQAPVANGAARAAREPARSPFAITPPSAAAQQAERARTPAPAQPAPSGEEGEKPPPARKRPVFGGTSSRAKT